MRKINYKSLILNIILPLAIGIIGSLLGSPNNFDIINKPSFSPPAIVFPIVWTILYTLMGISAYIIINSDDPDKKSAYLVYLIQLIVNGLWSLFFFRFGWYLFSFFWIILLIALVIIMIDKFRKINKTAGYLQIPYLIWLIFASILNLAIYLLN